MRKFLLSLIGISIFGLLSAQSLVFHEDFELPSGADSLASYSSSGSNTWGISTNLYVSGMRSDSAKCTPNDTLSLTTNVISTVGDAFVVLEFDHICKIEAFDEAIVEVSVDNGATWTKLDTNHYTGNSTNFGSGGNIFNATAYGGAWSSGQAVTPSNSWWKHESFNISSIAGNQGNVQIRFSLIDVNGMTIFENYGWFLDNIQVAASPSELVPPDITWGQFVTDTVFSSSPQTITAEITDNTGIDTAYLVYYTNGILTDTLGMTNFMADSFSVDIPFPGFGRTITYYLEAKDQAATQNIASTGNRSYYLKYQPGLLSSVVFSEGFNTGSSIPSTWTNTISGFWERPGGNHSSNTGPSGPYEGTGYVAVEASGSSHPNVTGSLVSPVIDLSSLNQPYLIFYFHMYGSTMGDLNVDVYDGSTWHQGVWTRSGQQHASETDPWTKAMVDLTPYKNAGSKIRFRGTTGSNYYSDMSVDDVKVGETQLPLPDAGVVELTAPTGGVLAGSSFDVKAKVKNYGGVELTTLDVDWALDGTAQTTYNYTDTLASGATSAELTLGNKTVTAGPHALKLWTSNPNDTTDFNVSNDTLEFSFYGCTSLLSGSYTIGGTSPDYATFSDAVLALNQCGINGPVTFNVAPGTYTEQFSINDISGASASNTVTFQSSSSDSTAVTVQYDATTSSDNYVVALNGAGYISFDGMTFKAQDNTYPRVVMLKQGAHDLSFTSNRFIGKTISGGAGADSALVVVTDTIGDNFTFTHNRLEEGTRGLDIHGIEINNVVVEHNEFINQWEAVAIVEGAVSPSVKYNYANTNSTHSNFNGLQITDATNGFELAYNEVYADTTFVGYGLQINTSSGTTSNPGMVYNNMVLVRGAMGTTTLSAGILHSESSNINYYYNTVKMVGSDQNSPALCLYDANSGVSSGIDIKNNIFTNFADGYVFFSQNVDETAFSNNYNDWYADGSGDFISLDGTVITDFAGWQTATSGGANSENIDPYFPGGLDIHTNNNLLNNTGTPITGITDDIDGDARDGSNPDMGADEFDASQYDLAVIGVISPQSGCGLTSAENVTIEIKNVGSLAISSLNVTYNVVSTPSAAVTDNISSSLNPGDTLTHTFSQTVDLDMSTLGQDSTFDFKAWVNNTNDPIPNNDSASWSVDSKYQPLAPVTSDTTILSGDSVTLTAVSNDTLFWYASDTASTELEKGSSFTTPQLFDTTTYWLEAKSLVPGSPIMITEYSSSPDDLEIQNVRNSSFDATGWQVYVNDGGGINSPASGVWNLGMFNANEVKAAGDSYSVSSFPNLAFNDDDWIMIIDDNGNIRDFVVGDGYSLSEIQNMSVSVGGYTGLNPVAAGEWSGPGVDRSQDYSRRLTYDVNDASDWATSGSGNFNQPNGMTIVPAYYKAGGCSSLRVPLAVNVITIPDEAQVIDVQTNTGCDLGMEPVTIDIFNAGSDTIDGGLTAAYKVDNNAYISPETVNMTIAPYDTVPFTFNALADISSAMSGNDTNYVITAYINLVGDTVNTNDTIVGDSIESLYTPSAPITSDTTILYGTLATLTAISNDTLYWYENDTIPSYLHMGKYFQTPVLHDTTTYYVSSKAGGGLNDTIGTGTSSQNYVPYYGFYDYSWSAIIIEASEIGNGGLIDTLAYYIDNSPSNYDMNDQRIWMTHTTNSDFTSTAKPDPSTMTQVYQGNKVYNTSGWEYFPLSTPFNYNGTDNIIIYTENHDGSYSSGYPQWRSTSVTGNKVIYEYQDGSFPTSSGSYTQDRPNIRLIASGSSGCESPRAPLTVNVDIPVDNAGITEIIDPTGSIQSSTPEPVRVELTNGGQNTLTSVDITWQLDGIVQDTISWTGNLPFGDKDTVLLDSFSFAAGPHSITAWSSMPNNIVDPITYDDTSSVSFGACMIGIFTIGDASSGTYDFNSFTEAINSIQLATVCGNVTFLVDTGTYVEQITIPEIPGVNSSNTVTFTSINGDSSEVTLEYDASSSDPYTIRFDGADYITFSHMTIRGLNSSNAEVVTFEDDSEHNQLLNNVIQAGGNGSSAVPVYSYDNIGVHYNIIRNNHIIDGEQAIYIEGQNGDEGIGNVIENNIIEGFNEDGLVLEYQDSSFVIGNTFLTSSNYSSTVYAMDLDDAHRIHVLNNKIIHTGSAEMTAINHYYCDGNSSYHNLIANNFIAITGGNDDNEGIALDNSPYTDVFYNTVNITGGNNQSSALYLDVDAGDSPVRIVNNIFRDSVGFAVLSDDDDAITVMDHNNYYSESINFIDWEGVIISDLSGFKVETGMNVSSMSVLPDFISTTDLHLTSNKFTSMGTPLTTVTTDIDGDPRGSISTTLGADEVQSLQIDISLIDILNVPATVNENDNIVPEVVVANFGTDTIANYTVEYTAKGGTPVTLNVTNDTILPYGGTDTLTLNSYSSPAGLYQLCAYTVLAADTNPYNDQYCQDVFGTPNFDGTVTKVFPLASGCGLLLDTVAMTIKNIGADTINPPFPAKYLVDGITMVEDTVQTQLLPGDSIYFEFTQKVDLSTTNFDSTFNIAAWIEVPGDNVQYNDTGYVSTTSKFTPAVPIVNDVTISYGSNVDLIAQQNSNSMVNWYENATIQTPFYKGDTLTTPILYADTTFWFNAQNGSNNSPIVITEYSSSPDDLEVQNVTNQPFDATGWTVYVNDGGGINTPVSGSWALGMFNANEVKASGDSYSNSTLPNIAFNDDDWIMIVDANGNIKDFVVGDGYTTAEIQGMSVNVGSFTGLSPVAQGEWAGPGVDRTEDFSRRMTYDSNDATDWITSASGNFNAPNGMTANPNFSITACASPRDFVNVFVVQALDNASAIDASSNSGCGLGMEPVTVTIVNNGTDTIDGGLTASYKVNNGSYITPENVNQVILPSDTTTYTFNTLADLTNTTSNDLGFVITSYVDLVGDSLHAKDTTMSDTVWSLYVPPAPIVNDTTIFYDNSVLLTVNPNDSNDIIIWYENDTTNSSLVQGTTYQTPILYDTTTYWIEASSGLSGSPILITEFSTSPDDIEIQNISNQQFDATGWQVYVNDGGGINNPVSGTWNLGVFNPNEVKAAGDSYSNSSFANLAFNDDDWIMIIDDKGNIMDFVVGDGYSISEIQNMNVNVGSYTGLNPVAEGEWNGAGVDRSMDYSRRLTYDANDATDWVTSGSGNFNQPNGMTANPGFAITQCTSPRVPLTVNVEIPTENAQAKIVTTNDGCALGMEPVTITIVNGGSNTINGGLTASFKVDDNPYITPESVNQIITPFDTITYTFTTLADLSGISTGDTSYVVTAYVDLIGDTLNYNDTVMTDTIMSLYTPLAPIANDTTGVYGDVLTITAQSSDILYWWENDSTQTFLDFGQYYATPVLYDTTTYYVSAIAATGCESSRVPLTINIDVPDANAALTEIMTNKGCNLKANEPVTIEIANLGGQPIDGNITASYRVNGGAYIAPENVTTMINPMDTGLYTFNTTHNMLAPLNDTSFVIEAYVSLQGDTFPGNDIMVTDTFMSKFTPNPPQVNDTTINFGSAATLMASSSSTVQWYDSDTSTTILDTGSVFTTPLLYDTTTYWVSSQNNAIMPLVISEVNLANPDYVEIQNVSGTPFDATGWQVIISDDYNDINVSNSITWNLGVIPANSVQYRDDDGGANDWGDNIFWNESNGGWVMIVDDKGKVREFIAWDWSFSDIQSMSVNEGGYTGLNPVNQTPQIWSGDGVSLCSQTIYRITADVNNATDFSCQTGDMGSPNNISVIGGGSFGGCESDKIAVNVNVTGAPDYDGQLLSIDEPSTGPLKTNAEPVVFRVKNNGTLSFNSVDLTYEFDGQAPVTETVNQLINPGDTLIHTFSSTVDMMNFKSYLVKGYIDVANDTINLNDTLFKSAENQKDYCISKATSTSYNYIEAFNMAGISTFNSNNAMYTDYTSTVAPGVVYPSVAHPVVADWGNASTFFSSISMKVFIDANRDGVFDEATETFMSQTISSSATTSFTGNVTLPANATPGLTVMRVVLQRTSNLNDVHPCGTYTYGETEDYLVQITPLIPNDAGVTQIMKPNTFNINANQQFEVMVRNFGSDTLNTFDIEYSMGNMTSTHTYNGMIAPQTEDTVSMPILTLPYGNHSLCVHTVVPNDSNTFNDYSCKNIYRSYTTQPPYIDNLEGNNYFMMDTSSSVTEWELGYPMGNNISAPHSGSNAWMIDLDDTYENTTEDMLYTPRFAITSKGVDSLVFWHYYDTEQGADGGYVQYQNTSGGWTNLGAINDTTAVNWYTDPLNGPEAFSGNSGGWIRSSICIDTAHVSNMASITQFRFIFISNGSGNGGDGWAIDDIWVKIPKQPVDAGVTSINNPVDSTIVGTQQHVSVDLRNFGLDMLTSIPVTYQVGNNIPVTETWTGSLAANSSTSYTFSQAYTAPGMNYKLCVYTEVVQDGNNGNDTTCRVIKRKTPPIDAGVSSVLLPSDTTTQFVSTTVSVRVKNYGSDNITSIPLEYTAGSQAPVNETWTGTLLAGDSVDYTFNTPFTAGTGTFIVCVKTLVSGDYDNSNDESCISVLANSIASNELPGFVLHQNIPNPANGATQVDFEVPYGGQAEFQLVDMFGRTLYVKDMHVITGRHSIDLDAYNLPAGVYYYSVIFDGHRLVRKMVVAK